MTTARHTAFGLHGDDHPFLIVQLAVRKRWLHADPAAGGDADETAVEVVYEPGDIAFYPRGNLHDVHGTGELSVHLSVAFDGFEGRLFDDLAPADRIGALAPRVGTSLPFSLVPSLVERDTKVRLAYSHPPPAQLDGAGSSLIETGRATVRISGEFPDVLEWVRQRRGTSARQIAARFDLDVERCVEFVRFGVTNGLLIDSPGD